MTGPRDAAMAGMLLVSSMLIFGAIGFGVGSPFGGELPLALVGGFIGLIVGFRLVYTRFKDL